LASGSDVKRHLHEDTPTASDAVPVTVDELLYIVPLDVVIVTDETNERIGEDTLV
jgi:hypothetical protein